MKREYEQMEIEKGFSARGMGEEGNEHEKEEEEEQEGEA
jgi:hypothetical protein